MMSQGGDGVDVAAAVAVTTVFDVSGRRSFLLNNKFSF